ncbi:unnamed protein product, partial [Callosobruchus maculatus]
LELLFHTIFKCYELYQYEGMSLPSLFIPQVKIFDRRLPSRSTQELFLRCHLTLVSQYGQYDS